MKSFTRAVVSAAGAFAVAAIAVAAPAQASAVSPSSPGLRGTDAAGNAVTVTEVAGTGERQAMAAPVGGNIVNVNSGRCLDVANAQVGNGVPIQQWDCLGSGQKNQIWWFANETHIGEYYWYNVVTTLDGQCLDVTGGSGATGNGVPVQQWNCLTGQTNQQWRLEIVGYGIRLIARHSGKCLDVVNASKANGARLQQWSCLGTANQAWDLY
ncbi:hypothetical protein Aph02nite_44640 [Actinoplanes philippinensis]|uniref:Glucosylceramidase n=1 Tax=Actinoplanes philippinensis TaxID=35752 RepID=A0A1I2I7Z0_9ACTN|nr:RICIN domain-containing protein [Actinoplanes philippinensis]GIE78514.1 hypothetical protein Aph02nite_44640 [Actinoplanes philippinensis]SFF38405.1 glucosylceramidase [Actinoplanes philippinensis]